jgi:Tol biopolymer transport system component
LGFFAGGKLKRIEAAGGPPQTLYSPFLLGGRGGTWNREGIILFAPSPISPLFRIPESGGQATVVTNLDETRHENSHRWPIFLPDGRHFLYFARSRQRENLAVFVGSLDSKEIKFLMNGNSNVLFAPATSGEPEGYLLFEREGWLVARRLSFPTLRFEGDPIPIAQGVRASDPFTAAMFTVSETGVLAYGNAAKVGPPQLAWFDRSGKQLGSMDSPGHCVDVRLSPDEKRVVLDIVNLEVGGREIWQADLARGVSTRLTLGDKPEQNPAWSPDGDRIAFTTSPTSSGADLYERPSSGAGNEQRLFHSDAGILLADWSRDGQFLLFEERAPGPREKLWALPMSGDRKPFPLLQTSFNESLGVFSPDGRSVAFVSDESGRPEVYVQTFPTPTAKWRVSTNGGIQPRWRRDGREIFYVAADHRLMAVGVKAGSSFEVGIPAVLFELGTSLSAGARHQYDVSADGQRFLVIRVVETQEGHPITVALNWEADLKK